ncbi:MAG: cupredoxin family copper-binding protein [bacterium]
MNPRVSFAILFAVIVLGGVGFALSRRSSGTTTSTTPTPSATPVASGSPVSGQALIMDIKDLAFANPDVTIKVGDSVTWTNKDSMAHTVTSSDGGPLSSSNLSTGQAYSFTFNEKGTFKYHCAIHPSMTGTVTVK